MNKIQIEEAKAIVAHQCIEDREDDYWLDFVYLRDGFIRDGYEFRESVDMAFAELDRVAA